MIVPNFPSKTEQCLILVSPTKEGCDKAICKGTASLEKTTRVLGFFFFSENAQHTQKLQSWCPGNDKCCINSCSKTSCHQAVELTTTGCPWDQGISTM